ncbi:MAG: putative CRISPR-associated protein [Gemmatales bacterium]|nr:putative CRISPR-associated protein [Gemmatales bacterium]MDW8386856.1 putative CRISPR-associated protein [Gemmatales bacterium]
MPNTVICSVGTSAARRVCSPANLAAWVKEQGGAEQAGRALFNSFADVLPQGAALQDTLSAEINSLVRIGVQPSDRVILLASDTSDGQACACAVALYLQKYFPGILVEIHCIKGLQVHDAELFRREGVVNYVRYCLRAIHDFGESQVILNPTGGYKALVPYTVLIGMIKHVPCRYIFEQSSQLLTLPPLPVVFDRGPFERYRSLIERIERETAIPGDVWEQEVRYDDRVLLEPLVERTPTEVTLSAVGLLLLDEVRMPTVLVPFLSRKAWEDCLDNLCQLRDCNPFRFLLRIAADRHQFRLAEHINAGNGLRWLKPGRTTDRYLISVEDWRLLVWRAIREDQVGSDYPHKVTVDPNKDRKRLGPFTRLEFADNEK